MIATRPLMCFEDEKSIRVSHGTSMDDVFCFKAKSVLFFAQDGDISVSLVVLYCLFISCDEFVVLSR